MSAEELVEEVAHKKPYGDGGREHQPEGAQLGEPAVVDAAGRLVGHCIVALIFTSFQGKVKLRVPIFLYLASIFMESIVDFSDRTASQKLNHPHCDHPRNEKRCDRRRGFGNY